MQLDGNMPLTLQLTVDSANIVLAALSTQPYDRVAALIGIIQQQARTQIEASQPQVMAQEQTSILKE